MDLSREYQLELLGKLHDPRVRTALLNKEALYPELFDADLHTAVKDILGQLRKNKLTHGQISTLLREHEVKGVTKQDVNGFDEEQLCRFARNRRIHGLLVQARTLLESNKPQESLKVLSEGVRKFQADSAVLDHRFEYGTLSDIPKGPARTGLCSTGLPSLDAALSGGPGEGDVAVLLGPTSAGKSSFLVHASVVAVRAGIPVLYITLEDSVRQILEKSRSALMQERNPTTVAWLKVRKKLKADLNVIGTGPRCFSLLDLEAALNQFPKTKLCCVDYADYLEDEDGLSADSYQRLGRLYDGMKQIARLRKLPIWTVSQVNRTAYGSPVVDMQHVEGSLKKVMAADQVLTIQRNEKEESAGGAVTGSFFVAKNRHGTRTQTIQFTARFDISTYEEGTHT